MITPVRVMQVGCVMLTVGAGGATGIAFITAFVGGDTHPAASFTLMG